MQVKSIVPLKAISHAREHALEQALLPEGPKESCGVVVNGEYHRCTNTHPDPANYFRIDKRRIASLGKLGEIQMIYHSHPDGELCPTKADMISQMATGFNYGIIKVDTKTKSASMPVEWGPGVPIAPLIGRELVPGIWDCYSLVRDYFNIKLNIILPDYPRDALWWEKDEDLYSLHFKEAGFVELQLEDLSEIQEHDCIMMNVGSKVINHAAIYLGGDSVMHHYGQRLSEIDEAGLMKWKRVYSKIVRHKDLMK